MKATIRITLLFIVNAINAQSQTPNKYPEIGDPVPDFILSDVQNYSKNQISKVELIGQYYILDFWCIGCASCVASFPKTQLLQDKFRDQVKFILVGRQEKKRKIRDYYSVYQKKDNLTLTSAYDSVLSKKAVHYSVPNIIWVDKEGIIKAITGVEAVKESNIKQFIAGGNFEFIDESFNARLKREENMNAMSSNKSLQDTTAIIPLLQTTLTISDLNISNYKVPNIDAALRKNPKKYQLSSGSVRDLYMIAYLGSSLVSPRYYSSWRWPEIRTKDSLKFRQPFKEVYNYSIVRNNNMDANSMMKIMQADLDACFGYKARIERKMMPYLKLVIINSQIYQTKITKGGKLVANVRVELSENIIENWRIEGLLHSLMHFLPGIQKIAFNETGSNDLVSMKISANLLDLESIRNGLRENGLDLLPSSKYFDVLIIED